MEKSDENIETIMDVDSFEDHGPLLYSGYDNTSETNFQCDLSQYSLDNESVMIIDDDDDDDDSLSDISNSEIIDEKNELNVPTSIKMPEQKNIVCDDFEDDSEDDFVDDSDIEIYEETLSINKKILSAATKNTNVITKQKENDSLNVKKLKNSSIAKSNPLLKSNQIKLASEAATNRLKTTTMNLQPESSSKNKFSQKGFYKLKSSKGTSSDVFIIPHNGMNYMITKKSPSMKSNHSLSTKLKAPSTVVTPNEQNKQVISKAASRGEKKEESNFVARIQQQLGKKYKVVPDQGQVPINLDRVFKRNPNFTKQKMATNSTPNRHKNGDFFRLGNSCQLANNKETRNVQHKIVPTHVKSSWSKMSKTIDLTNENKNKKFIPHTITSKDATEKNTSCFVKNGNVYPQKINPTITEIIDLSDDSPPLSPTKYGLYK
jgi:hypothetical protein